MFSKLFRREYSTSFFMRFAYSDKKNLSIVGKTVHAIQSAIESGKEDDKRNRSELYKFIASARNQLILIENLESYVAQKRVNDIHSAAVQLHREVRSGLSICNFMSVSVAEDNALPANRMFPPMYDIGENHFRSAYEQEVLAFDSNAKLPEYIFVSAQLRAHVDNPDRYIRHFAHTTVFTRVFMELLVLTSRIISSQTHFSEIPVPLVKRIVESKRSLVFLQRSDLTLKQLVTAEEERESVLKSLALEQDVKLNNERSYVGLIENVSEVVEEAHAVEENTELLLFLNLISELEKDYHRRDIFFAIAAFGYFVTAERPTLNGLWRWLERHLSAFPYQVSYYDTPITVRFASGALIHEGLLTDNSTPSVISKESFKSNNYKVVRPVALEIKNFLQEKNIRNIPSIP